MKKHVSKLLIATFLLTSISACQQSITRSDGAIKKETVGALGGAVAGGVIGSKFGKGTGNGIAIGIGTLLGAVAGSSIGQSLDNADIAQYNASSQRALESSPTGREVAWRNPDSGNYGTITPTNTYQADNGQYCREYSQTINVGGQSERAYGTACRNSDGSWKVVN